MMPLLNFVDNVIHLVPDFSETINLQLLHTCTCSLNNVRNYCSYFIVHVAPPPPFESIRGSMHVPIFLKKGVFFGHLSWEDFLRNPGKGGVFCNLHQWLPIPDIGGFRDGK